MVLDYGDRLQIPMKLRVLLNEGSAFEKNQCSIIHLAAGIEWQLQKRPNRLPLKNRVISTASELRISEHHNASKMLEQFSKEESCADDERLLVDALVRDVLAANHDRDFRFWSLFCGEEIMCQNLCIRIVELNNRDARTGVYNFTSENWAGGEREVLYMLAYRGHMRFMKQSRLATDVRWEKWRGEFAQIFDMRLMKREDIKSLNELVAGVESRQCRHCPASCHVRLQYPGIGSAQAVPCRMAGHTSKRHTRTNEQRREQNERWAKKLFEMSQISDQIEMPGRSSSVPIGGRSFMEGRTGVLAETDAREETERFSYPTREESGMATFSRPPTQMIGSDIPPGISAPTALPVGPSACKTKSAPPRRSSQIELAPSGILESETVDMRMTLPKRAEETIDFVGRGTGQGTVNYPIHDLNWRGGIIAHEETQWYADAVAKLGDYSLTAFGEIIRLGNQMAMVAVGYRLAARELQELNFRKRSHVTARIEDMQHVFPAIAPQLIDISRRGMIPGYRGAAPPEKRVTRYPYVPDDAEKLRRNSGKTFEWESWWFVIRNWQKTAVW